MKIGVSTYEISVMSIYSHINQEPYSVDHSINTVQYDLKEKHSNSNGQMLAGP